MFWIKNAVKVGVEKSGKTTILSLVLEAEKYSLCVPKKLSSLRNAHREVHWVKSMFCWVSVVSVLKRCSSTFLIQAVIISHLKWGSILFPRLGECDAQNCLRLLRTFLGRCFPHLLLSTCHMCLCWLIFLYHIKPALLVFTSHAFHVLYSRCLSSLIHYQVANSCLQPASDTCIQHPLP